jgi:hypothetical protein
MKVMLVYDLFGSTMNMCAKINSNAPANNLAIGGDLFLVLRSLFSNAIENPMEYLEVS